MKPDVAWLRLVTAAGTGFCSQQCSIKTILTVLHGIASLLDSAYKVSQTEERGPNTIAMVVVFSAHCDMPTLTWRHPNNGRSKRSDYE